MASYVHMLLFLLALTTCRGRKLADEKTSPETGINPPTSPGDSPGMGHRHNMQPNVQDVSGINPPTSPGDSPGMGHRHESGNTDEGVNPPTSPGHSPGIGHSLTGQKRNMPPRLDGLNPPTSPGDSPGMGHRLKSGNMQITEEDQDPRIGRPNGYPPTTPGHSPGIGH